jgi:predicted RNA-binding Zn ribbon-like protein
VQAGEEDHALDRRDCAAEIGDSDSLRRSEARPLFEWEGEGWRLRWVGPVADSVASTTAMSLLEAIRDDGWERFGICAGAPCCCVFVDRSKNRSRRFCSDLCADRVAQALHRARRRPERDVQRSDA